MVREMPRPGERPLHWVGSSKKDFLAFPDWLVRNMGYALSVAQFGGHHPSAKRWMGEGSGVFEVAEEYAGNAYRAIYTVRFTGKVYMLHAFRKKSPKGIKTARTDVALVRQRLKAARRDHEARNGDEGA